MADRIRDPGLLREHADGDSPIACSATQRTHVKRKSFTWLEKRRNEIASRKG